MNRRKIRLIEIARIPLRAVALALAGLVTVACGAAAQDDAPTEGVVLQVMQESTTRHVEAERVADEAAAAGIDTNMLSMLFGQLTNAAGVAAAEMPGEFAAMLPPGFMNKLQLGGQFAAYKLGGELRDMRTPESESSAYVIFIRPDLFVMQSPGARMVWLPGGSMYYTDPATGQLRPAGAGLRAADAMVDQVEHSGADLQPLPGNPTRQILGHTAYGYHYGYTMDLGMGGFGPGAATSGMPASVQNVVEGEAWIAPDLPEADQVAAFYRNFADSFGDSNGMMGGQTGVMTSLASLGVPLETSETIKTYMLSTLPGSDDRVLVVEGTSKSTVTAITSREIEDEELFGPGGMPAELGGNVAAGTPAAGSSAPSAGAGKPNSRTYQVDKPCDCSCEAFEALKEMEDDDPNALGKAMCAQKCTMTWVQQCVQP
jgi:hypothetical protein